MIYLQSNPVCDMSYLKIMLGSATMPDSKSFIPLFFDNLLPVLKSKINVQMVWLVYKPDKLDLPLPIFPDTSILDIHNYENALQVLQKEKPDIIFASASWDLIDYALSSAAKSLKIPVVTQFMIESFFTQSFNQKLISYTKRFFENTTPTDTSTSKKKFMKRGKFFIYKYIFLLKTHYSIHHNIFQTLKVFFIILKKILNDYKIVYDSRFSNTIHWLQSESLIETLVKAGFKRSSLVVTGNPMFDEAFKKIQNWKSKSEKRNKICILLAPSTLYEHGMWTRQQRDDTIKQIIKTILEHNNELSLKIKIHPSSANFLEYKTLVHDIDESIEINQQGNILDLLYDSDVVITFGYTFVDTYSIISKKPLIICNFFDSPKDDFVKEQIAIECTSTSSLLENIYQSISKKNEYEEKCNDYMKNYFYKPDGLAAERISNSVIELIKHKLE